MKIINEMKLTFSALSINESFARTSAVSFFAQSNPAVSDLADIKTAVSEAVTNCIVHGYRDIPRGKVELTARLLSRGDSFTAYIKVRDKGCGIENIELAMTPLYTSAPSEERAGLGFSVMESFMDSVKVSSHIGKGTTVVMTKKLANSVKTG